MIIYYYTNYMLVIEKINRYNQLFFVNMVKTCFTQGNNIVNRPPVRLIQWLCYVKVQFWLDFV
jgi:hypothetical protein